MKSLPSYPVFDNEKYLSLGYKYQLCDQHYRLITTNQVLCEVEYQADGSSMNMFRQYYTNPKSFAFVLLTKRQASSSESTPTLMI